jgi:hypothetical protein
MRDVGAVLYVLRCFHRISTYSRQYEYSSLLWAAQGTDCARAAPLYKYGTVQYSWGGVGRVVKNFLSMDPI